MNTKQTLLLHLHSKELAKLKLIKATGLDGLRARLLRDAAPVIARPITYLVNLTISTVVIPSEWKDARASGTHF